MPEPCYFLKCSRAENEPRVVGARMSALPASLEQLTDDNPATRRSAPPQAGLQGCFLAVLTVRGREGLRACARGTLCQRSGDFPLGKD